jgi:deoxycytidine triphosphate deaminase
MLTCAALPDICLPRSTDVLVGCVRVHYSHPCDFEFEHRNSGSCVVHEFIGKLCDGAFAFGSE